MTAEDTARLARERGVRRVECGQCHRLVHVTGDEQHLVARNVTHTAFVVLCVGGPDE